MMCHPKPSTRILGFCLCLCFILGISTSQANRRKFRNMERQGAVRNYYPKEKDLTVRYNANDKALHLHRKAIKAYWQKQYNDANACFSLALKNWTDYSGLIQDYILCSVLVEGKYRDVPRAKGLVQLEIRTHEKRRTTRSYLVEGIFYIQAGDYQKAYESLINIDSGEYLPLAKTLIKRMHHNMPVMSPDIIKNLLPVRNSLREIREERGSESLVKD